jgi:hypothetical protein
MAMAAISLDTAAKRRTVSFESIPGEENHGSSTDAS